MQKAMSDVENAISRIDFLMTQKNLKLLKQSFTTLLLE